MLLHRYYDNDYYRYIDQLVESSYYATNEYGSRYISNFACSKCITGAKMIMNLNIARVHDVEFDA